MLSSVALKDIEFSSIQQAQSLLQVFLLLKVGTQSAR